MLTRKLPCPSCGVGLRIAGDLPARRKITCPKCGNGFPVPEGNGQASAPEKAVVRVRRPAPLEEDEERNEEENAEIEERPVVRKRRRPLPPEDDDEPDGEDEDRPLPRKRRKFRKKKPASRMPLILGLVIGGADCSERPTSICFPWARKPIDVGRSEQGAQSAIPDGGRRSKRRSGAGGLRR